MCADDPWAAVVKLKSGAEIRVVKKGSTQPVTGNFAEANDERLVWVVKNEQQAIPKDQVDRLDARAPVTRRVKVDGKTTTEDPQTAKEPAVGMNGHAATTTNTASSLSWEGKPPFETVYRRPMGMPKGTESKK
jgi:hypothetical protein